MKEEILRLAEVKSVDQSGRSEGGFVTVFQIIGDFDSISRLLNNAHSHSQEEEDFREYVKLLAHLEKLGGDGEELEP